MKCMADTCQDVAIRFMLAYDECGVAKVFHACVMHPMLVGSPDDIIDFNIDSRTAHRLAENEDALQQYLNMVEIIEE